MLYNIVLVSAIQQHKSGVSVYIHALPPEALSPSIPSQAVTERVSQSTCHRVRVTERVSQSAGLGPCVTWQLPISCFCTWWCVSVSAALLIHFLLCIHKTVCVSIPALQLVHQCRFSRCHVYTVPYCSCFLFPYEKEVHPPCFN